MKSAGCLKTLLASLFPVRIEGEFVYCTFPAAHYGDYSELQPMASIMEDEGLSLIVRKAIADENKLTYAGVFACISLGAYSSLEAVGLTATVAPRLAAHGVATNMIAGYHHDHIFVQTELADLAISVLQELSASQAMLDSESPDN